MQKYSISTTDEYDEWLENETLKSQLQIDKRLEKIKSEGHFGHINDNLGERLSELKFNEWKTHILCNYTNSKSDPFARRK